MNKILNGLKSFYIVLELIIVFLLMVLSMPIILTSLEYVGFKVGAIRFFSIVAVFVLAVINILLAFIFKHKEAAFYIWVSIPAIIGFMYYKMDLGDLIPFYIAYFLMAIINSLIGVIEANKK